MAPVIKNSPANVGDIRDAGSIPGLERSSEGGHRTHSSVLAWRIPWTDGPWGHKKSDMTEATETQAVTDAFSRLYQLLFSKSSVRYSFHFLVSSEFLLHFHSVSYPAPVIFIFSNNSASFTTWWKNEPCSLKSRVMMWRPHFLVPSVIRMTFLKGQEGKNLYWVSAVSYT